MAKLIVGLGNPGAQYKWTRHNLGFFVLEAFAAQYKVDWRNSLSYQGMVSRVMVQDVECSLLMPLTFMNNSGLSVRKLADKQSVPIENILIVCDDLSLSYGKMRLRPSGSAGGQNGLKSIIKELGSNQFSRLRLGIDEPVHSAHKADYVLSNFTSDEKKALPEFINHALDCVTCWVTEGAEVAMNKFN
jgi:PTH1 family peptidyl-tRNA hydrolase